MLFMQVRRLMALFKPMSVSQPAPRDHRDERPCYEERRHFHQYEDRRHSLPVEERRSQVVVHVPPPEDSYRGTHFAPFPLESRHGQFLANAQDDHRYYQQPLTTSEARHITLGSESSHIPLTVGSHHVTSLAESRYVPLAYYHHLAPSSDDSYYRSRANPAHER